MTQMNVDLYKRYFRDVEYTGKHDSLKPYTILTVQGRQYPVDILQALVYALIERYASSPVANYVECAASVRNEEK